MTISISLKVQEGLVLAADSASTVVARTPDGQTGVVNVYNNANKIFNLLKGLPIAATTWGVGAIGEASIAMIMKDLRQRFSGEDRRFRSWRLNPAKYAVADVAARLREFVFEERYTPFFADWPDKPALGFFVGGYSSGATLAEEFQIDISEGLCEDARPLRATNEVGVTWSGAIEPISRLVIGFSPALPIVLTQNLGISPERAGELQAVLHVALSQPLVQAAMPLQDAIDLAEYLADVAIRYHQFAPGAPVVGGPIEIAAISKHEGFKWIRRKYYYSRDLNPPVEADLPGSVKALSPRSRGAPLTEAEARRGRSSTTTIVPSRATSPRRVSQTSNARKSGKR